MFIIIQNHLISNKVNKLKFIVIQKNSVFLPDQSELFMNVNNQKFYKSDKFWSGYFNLINSHYLYLHYELRIITFNFPLNQLI